MARKSEVGVKVAEVARANASETPRLKQRYKDEIIPALHDEFHYDNVMRTPGLVKIVVNMGVGDAAQDSKVLSGAINDLTLITGQKPQVTKARKSIAQFKLREGQPIGVTTHTSTAPATPTT